jgi:two-component system sensor histidine kinase BarA
MDIHMPVLDGVQAAELIRSRERGDRHTPIVALTADIVPEHRDQAFSAGIDDYLIKPVVEVQLWQAIERLLKPEYAPVQRIVSSSIPETVADQGEHLPSRDLGAALKTAGGREDLAEELFQRLLAELPEQMETLHRHLQHGEWGGLRENSHRMHGTTAVCGVPALNSLMGKIEQAALRQDTDETRGLLQAATTEIDRLVETAPNSVPTARVAPS